MGYFPSLAVASQSIPPPPPMDGLPDFMSRLGRVLRMGGRLKQEICIRLERTDHESEEKCFIYSATDLPITFYWKRMLPFYCHVVSSAAQICKRNYGLILLRRLVQQDNSATKN